MVVIVIIGILAAIAIPKLFGMSAKAKAQEVGPAVGTWTKLQMAYKMESSEWGTSEQISYKLPGDKPEGPSSKTANFEYTVEAPSGTTAKWSGKSVFQSDPCGEGSEWTAELGNYGENAEMDITVGSAGTVGGCISLTPNYFKIGCTNNTSKTSTDPACTAAGP
jgi:type II secretory pathway pseudopilin PulG